MSSQDVVDKTSPSHQIDRSTLAPSSVLVAVCCQSSFWRWHLFTDPRLGLSFQLLIATLPASRLLMVLLGLSNQQHHPHNCQTTLCRSQGYNNGGRSRKKQVDKADPLKHWQVTYRPSRDKDLYRLRPSTCSPVKETCKNYAFVSW